MNFLAHLYLSGESDGIKTGNFIGDYVKGKRYEQYEGDIRKGILLHRAIDDFTDTNIHFREAKTLFKNHYGRYAGIVADVVFDHLLAGNWKDYSVYALSDFTRNAHAVLLSNFFRLPFRVKQFLPIMIRNKRLESYATPEGLETSLRIMADYTSLPAQSHQINELVSENRAYISGLFAVFMEEIVDFVETGHNIIILKPVGKLSW